MIYLFDCDGTLWASEDHDYIGSVVSDIVRVSDNAVRRSEDGKVFMLFPHIRKTFDDMKERASVVGIVSDNPPEMVEKALHAFGLYTYITPEAVNVRLWKGYCPKHVMVEEILAKPLFAEVPRDQVFLIDDKDYSKEAARIGISFVPAQDVIPNLFWDLVRMPNSIQHDMK